MRESIRWPFQAVGGLAEAGDVVFGGGEVVLYRGGVVFMTHDGGEQFRGHGAAFLEISVGVAAGVGNMAFQTQASH